MKRKYTFEDWKDGTVEKEWLDWGLDFDDQDGYEVGDLPKEIFRTGEYERTQNEREKAFQKAVRINANFKLNQFRRNIQEPGNDPVKRIREEIAYLDEKYDSFDSEIRHQVRLGILEFYGLDHQIFQAIHKENEYSPSGLIEINKFDPGSETAGTTHFVETNKWFDILVNRSYKTKLNELLESSNKEGVNNPKSGSRAWNYSGDLREECIIEMKELRNCYPTLDSVSFFKEAYAKLKCCQTSETGEEIKWATLRNRVKERYPDFYESLLKTK